MASVVRLPEHAGGGRVEQVAVGPERRSLSLHFVAFLTDLRAVLASSAVVHCADAHVAAPATSPPASRVSLRMRVPPWENATVARVRRKRKICRRRRQREGGWQITTFGGRARASTTRMFVIMP